MRPVSCSQRASGTTIFMLFALCLGFAPFVRADAPALVFADYPGALPASVKHHAYVAEDPGMPSWESKRKAMAIFTPNLAGHYVAYTLDCGTGAVCGEIMDSQTGKVVTSFPDAYYTGENVGADEDFDFSTRPDSRLLIIQGRGQGDELDQHGKVLRKGFYERYYAFDGQSLKLVFVQ